MVTVEQTLPTVCENEILLVTSKGQRKKSESLTEFEPITSQTPGGHSIHLSYGELM